MMTIFNFRNASLCFLVLLGALSTHFCTIYDTIFSHTMGSQVAFKNPATATLLELVKSRRTYYGLKAESPVPDSVIENIVKDSVLHVPSSFNTQTTRIVLLLKKEHEKLWDIALEIMEGLVAAGTIPKETFEQNTKPKFEGFRNGYGTV
jgi:Predicted oxidoreductase related to nitroreductase